MTLTYLERIARQTERDCRGCGDPVTDLMDHPTAKLCATCRRASRMAHIDTMRAAKVGKVVYATEKSNGEKIGPVSATYAAQQSCPTDCAFLHAGCYAENGFVGGFITKPLNRARPGVTPLEVAELEAEAIDGLSAVRDLRLHVVGDSATIAGTHMLAMAAARYVARGAAQGFTVRVWTYTHAWREVPREAWGCVSVLASCETPADIILAGERGYATALTVLGHPGPQRYDAGPLSILPCPEQTKGITCADCRLCMDDTRLRETGMTVAFALHGLKYVAGESLRRRRAEAVS